MAFSKGDTVEWLWGSGTGEGVIDEVFTEKVTRTIKGKDITRNATKDEPAYLIRQKDGDTVIKSASELTRA
ncbi:MAG: DUF2945 domain-containing protein [Rhodobacterales bacterium 17-64-5]|nr:MAG: DUF2945 domain-containing protein [Rhodobacterales bacterium 12-65-15]OZA05344.1 MAG: DUF2945 domain-containing protein [Rhodobacterales bacterium 17-64-5]